jgi:hypothetical protein
MESKKETPALAQQRRGRGQRPATAPFDLSVSDSDGHVSKCSAREKSGPSHRTRKEAPDRQATAAEIAVPLGLQRSPFASDGGELIGRDPNDITREEWKALRPVRMVGLRAMRAKCLDCAHTPGEVRRCVMLDCALWPFRMGSVPRGCRASAGAGAGAGRRCRS